MANNVVFKTELLKGATGDRGEAGVAESVPTDGVILTTSEIVPQGYEEIDVGDIFTELEAEIEERAKEDIVTDAYDATHTYNSGDYAIYNDTLYKCNTDNTTGAFNGNYWDAVTVMGEIADAQDDITTLNSTLTAVSGISMEPVTVKSGVSIDVMGSQILYKYGYFCFVHLCFQTSGAISAGTVIFELPAGSYQGLGNYAAYATDGTVKTIDITTDGKIKNGIALASGVKLEFNAPCFRT